MKKYTVISLSFDNDCNLKCAMCYKNKWVADDEKADYSFWLDCIPYFKQITDQIALGNGEVFLHPEFVGKFAERATKEGLIVNVTSNGKLTYDTDILKNIRMLSISLDRYKYSGPAGIKAYMGTTKHLSQFTEIGCNLLMEEWMFRDYKWLVHMIHHLFKDAGVSRVFALSPKNWDAPDILKHQDVYKALSLLFKHFYVDDLTQSIISNNSYENWKEPCHYARDMVSIDECKNVMGCSFDEKPLMTLEKPSDILKIPTIKYKKRYSCPYLKIPGG